MELRRLTIWLALFVIAAISQSSEGHSVQKRETENDLDYDDPQADEGTDNEAQNDADGNVDGDEEEGNSYNSTILTQPTTYNVTVGKTIRLECRIDPPNSEAVVQWSGDNETMYFFGQTIITSDHRFTVEPGTTDLLIHDVRVSDSGTYHCGLMQNDMKSIEHRLIVKESPRIVSLTATDNGRVKEGSKLVLTCEVSGSPPITINWSKSVVKDGHEENVNLNESSGNFTGNSVSMTATHDVSGTYLCWAFNQAGSAQKKINVYVVGKPHVRVSETVVSADIGVTVEVSCTVNGHPTPSFHWMKDGTDIEYKEHYYKLETIGDTSVLSFTPQSESEFGTFTCFAENEHGNHSRSVSLVQTPAVRALAAGGGALTWSVTSHRPLTDATVQLRDLHQDKMYIYNVPVPMEGHHTTTMKFIIPEQELKGVYEAIVKVKNEKGWSENSAPVLVEIEEQPLQSPTVVASIFGGNDSGSNSLRPASSAVVSTLLMYLLVRML